LWWSIGGGLLFAASAWALYVSDWYLFLAHAFQSGGAETQGSTAFLAGVQGHAVAFGPLLIVIVGLAVSRAFIRRTGAQRV
jgi:hypothetical protein